MADESNRVTMHSGSLFNLTLGKAGQMAQGLGTGHNPPILVNLALELDLVIHRTLF